MILLFAPFTVLVLAHSVDVVVDRNDLVAFAQLAFSGAMASCGIVRGGGYVPAPRCTAGGGVFDASRASCHRPPATAVRRGGAVSAPKPAIGTAHPGTGSVRGARRRAGSVGPVPPSASHDDGASASIAGTASRMRSAAGAQKAYGTPAMRTFGRQAKPPLSRETNLGLLKFAKPVRLWKTNAESSVL